MKNIWKVTRNYFFNFFYIFLLAIPPLVYAENQNLSFKQAWEYVLKNHNGIKAEELGVEKSQKLSLASKLTFLPNIDITATYIHLAEPVHLNLAPISKALPQINLINQDIIIGSLNIIYPLYTGGKRWHGVNIAKLQEKDAKEALRLKKLATFEELAKIYYGVWLQQEIYSTLQEMQKSAQIHYNNALKLQKAGQIAKIEVLGAQVALDKSKNKSKEAKNKLEISQIALNTALDLKNTHPTSNIEVKKPKKYEDFFVQKTLDSYPVLKSLDQKISIASEARKIEIAKLFPDVALMGSYFMDNNFLLHNQSLPSWYIGITARLPLVSAGGKIPQIQAAKIVEMQLDKTKAQAIKDMEVLARSTYKEVIFAQEEYWSLESSIKLAQENLKLQEVAFNQGLATSIQVIDARNMLSNTLIEQKTIAYKYVILLSKLMALSDNIAMFYELQQ